MQGFAVLVAVLLSACATPDSPAASNATRRDSAGIEIVENILSAGPPRVAFIVSTEPTVDIGSREGATEYLLSGVRGAYRLSDGRIVVGELDAHLRYYDSSGKHLRTVSLRGSGPGELPSIGEIQLHRGDSLLLLCCSSSSSSRNSAIRLTEYPSTYRSRVSLYDAEARLGRIANISWALAPVRVVVIEGQTGFMSNGDWWQGFQTMAPDGSFLVRGSAWPVLEGAKGRRWRQTPYFRVTADHSDTMIVLPTTDEYENPETRDSDMPTFWRTSPDIVLDSNHLYWGNSDAFEIRVYDIAAGGRLGNPWRIIRHAHPNKPMIGESRRIYDEELIKEAKNKEDSAYFLRARTGAANTSLPAYDAFRVDAQKQLWVRHARALNYSNELLNPREAQTWSVFDKSGTFVGDVVTPGGFEIGQIGRDWLLGVWKDSDDVEHVRMYGLTTPR